MGVWTSRTETELDLCRGVLLPINRMQLTFRQEAQTPEQNDKGRNHHPHPFTLCYKTPLTPR
eukprot:6191177-Amphidinium_carterae.1